MSERAEPFRFSRYESPAHAALSAVEDAGWAPTKAARATVEDGRCASLSEDGRRCHGDVGHYGTHWAGAMRIWSDTETLVRPISPEVTTQGSPDAVSSAATGLADPRKASRE